jgi:hypothetical protein
LEGKGGVGAFTKRETKAIQEKMTRNQVEN